MIPKLIIIIPLDRRIRMITVVKPSIDCPVKCVYRASPPIKMEAKININPRAVTICRGLAEKMIIL